MDEGTPENRQESLKLKLEVLPYSEAEVWVTLEAERMFITQAGKQIRISTGGMRDFKPDELEQIRTVVANINTRI